ncbi:putative GH3 family protein [Helianthus annuus]|uniref:GH3 family protein n=1 Tax=Helianthus annuus TaxID=4232 RepID=A0A9K3NWG8_HELAN|nr:putative GH3 family protein [Helianthus annuus]
MYCQLLSGMIHRQQVLRLGAVFASALPRAISFLERNWVSLCNDIRTVAKLEISNRGGGGSESYITKYRTRGSKTYIPKTFYTKATYITLLPPGPC